MRIPSSIADQVSRLHTQSQYLLDRAIELLETRLPDLKRWLRHPVRSVHKWQQRRILLHSTTYYQAWLWLLTNYTEAFHLNSVKRRALLRRAVVHRCAREQSWAELVLPRTAQVVALLLPMVLFVLVYQLVTELERLTFLLYSITTCAVMLLLELVTAALTVGMAQSIRIGAEITLSAAIGVFAFSDQGARLVRDFGALTGAPESLLPAFPWVLATGALMKLTVAAALSVWLLLGRRLLDLLSAMGPCVILSPNYVAMHWMLALARHLIWHRDDWAGRRGRKHLLLIFRHTYGHIEQEMMSNARSSGADSEQRDWIAGRSNGVIRTLKGYERLLLDAFSREQYEELIKAIIQQAERLGNGDWDGVSEADRERPKKPYESLARRLTPAAVFAAAALSLDYLPVLGESSQTAGMKVTLLVASVLSLIAPESPTKAIFDGFRDLTKRQA